MDKERLSKVVTQLEKNNFEVFFADNLLAAKDIFEKNILNDIEVSSVSYADSITMKSSGVLELIRAKTDVEFIDTFNPDHSWREQINQRKKALTVDLFLSGTNAITEAGQLVNLDMIGNRVAALSFGPRYVVLFVGKNKLVKDLDEGFKRIKTVSAPLNAKNHPKLKLPCQVSGVCHDCQSPQRICNTWTITEKSYPKNRIKIILINEEQGY